MTLMFLDDESKRRIDKYIGAAREMHIAGATKRSLEEARSYAVEALTSILLENKEATGYDKHMAFIAERRQQQKVSA